MTRPFAIAIAGIVLAAHAQGARPLITIECVFVDAANGTGIPNARVELRQRHWGFPLEPAETPLATTTTDQKGRFHFTGSWHGRFRLCCFSHDRRKMGIREIAGEQRDIRIVGD